MKFLLASVQEHMSVGKSYLSLLPDKKNSDPAECNVFKCCMEHVKHKNYMGGRMGNMER